MNSLKLCLALLMSAFLSTSVATAAEKFTTLNGSKAKVESAYNYALKTKLTFVRDAPHLERFVEQKLLVKLSGNENYTLHDVSFPYVRPAGKMLTERLSAQFKKATGETLRVNSTVRTQEQHFWNSSDKSVHPAGIAIDFHVPESRKAQKWLEDTLLALQSKDVVLATHEHNPPHYHVVVLPREYMAYVASRKK